MAPQVREAVLDRRYAVIRVGKAGLHRAYGFQVQCKPWRREGAAARPVVGTIAADLVDHVFAAAFIVVDGSIPDGDDLLAVKALAGLGMMWGGSYVAPADKVSDGSIRVHAQPWGEAFEGGQCPAQQPAAAGTGEKEFAWLAIDAFAFGRAGLAGYAGYRTLVRRSAILRHLVEKHASAPVALRRRCGAVGRRGSPI